MRYKCGFCVFFYFQYIFWCLLTQDFIHMGPHRTTHYTRRKIQDTSVSKYMRASHSYMWMYQFSTYIHKKRNSHFFGPILYMKQCIHYIYNCLSSIIRKLLQQKREKQLNAVCASQTISKQHIKNALKLRTSTCATSKAYEERHSVKQIVKQK
mgnify:CR=1 FL=1